MTHDAAARRAKRSLGIALALACLALPARHAAAAPLGATIGVERSERAGDCPDAAELTAQVERILQRSLARGTATDQLEVQVHFARSGDEYLADVHSLGKKPGERSLHDRGATCAPLAEAVSVTIALLLDKELERRTSGSDAASAAAPPAPSATAPPAGTKLKPAPSEGERQARDSSSPSAGGASAPLELRATLEGGGVFGIVDHGSELLAENVGVRFQPGFIVDAGFNAVLPSTRHFREGTVHTTLLFASARACYLWGRAFSIGPCAAFGVGRLQGVGIGYQNNTTQNLTWAAAGAGVVAEGPVWGRVFWGVSGALWVPTRASSFSVQNLGTAWDSSPVAGSVALRVGFRIF